MNGNGNVIWVNNQVAMEMDEKQSRVKKVLSKFSIFHGRNEKKSSYL